MNKTLIYKDENRKVSTSGNYTAVSLASETFELIKGTKDSAVAPYTRQQKEEVNGVNSWIKSYTTRDFDVPFLAIQEIVVDAGKDSEFGPAVYWIKTSDITPEIEVERTPLLPTDF